MTSLAAQAAEPPIPYRQAGELSGSDLLSVLGLTLSVLVAALLVAVVSKRRGWLRRWGAIPSVADADELRIEQSLRIGTRTSVHRIANGGNRYLLVESINGVQLLPLEGRGAGEGTNDGRA